jgi:hypothetical protein
MTREAHANIRNWPRRQCLKEKVTPPLPSPALETRARDCSQRAQTHPMAPNKAPLHAPTRGKTMSKHCRCTVGTDIGSARLSPGNSSCKPRMTIAWLLVVSSHIRSTTFIPPHSEIRAHCGGAATLPHGRHPFLQHNSTNSPRACPIDR